MVIGAFSDCYQCLEKPTQPGDWEVRKALEPEEIQTNLTRERAFQILSNRYIRSLFLELSRSSDGLWDSKVNASYSRRAWHALVW